MSSAQLKSPARPGERKTCPALPPTSLCAAFHCLAVHSCSSHHTTSGRLVSPEKRAWTPINNFSLPNCSLVDIGARLYVSACSPKWSTSAPFPLLPAWSWAYGLPFSLLSFLLSSPLLTHVWNGEILNWSTSPQFSQREETIQRLQQNVLLSHQARDSQAAQVNIQVYCRTGRLASYACLQFQWAPGN